MRDYWLSAWNTELSEYTGGPGPEERRVEIRSRILAWYEAGKPFYTRKAIADFREQLRVARPGDFIHLQGLDDSTVQCKVRTGDVMLRGWHCPEEDVLVLPFIEYLSIQELLDINEMTLPKLVYCPLRLGHWSQERNNITQKFLPRTPLASATEVENLFGTTRKAWEASSTCTQLRSLLESQEILRGVSKVVAFACGSIADYAGEQAEDATYMLNQHALILTLQDIFGSMKNADNPPRIPCYGQDPAYDESDIVVLEKAGITILDDPQGFLEVDETTAVISAAPDIPVRQVVTDLTLPLLMIWDNHECNGYDARRTDSGSPRMEKIFEKHYHVFDFPGNQEGFEGLAIYVRKTAFFTTDEDDASHLPTLPSQHTPWRPRPLPEEVFD